MRSIMVGIICGMFCACCASSVWSDRSMRPSPYSYPHPQPYTDKANLGGQVISFSGGEFAGIPSGAVDFWFQNVLDTAKFNLRVGARYAQSDTKYALAFADGVYLLYDATRLKTYLGGGINWLAYMSGSKSGSIGGEAYLGMEMGSWKSGSIYAEAGYGAIRTGFSPSIKGLIATIGYKTGM